MKFINYLNERILYHGTVGDLKLRPGILYLTPFKNDALVFGAHPVLRRDRQGQSMLYKIQAGPGKTKDIDEVVTDALFNDGDVEDTINQAAKVARKEGYRYMKYDHGGFLVIVSLYPDKDLSIQ